MAERKKAMTEDELKALVQHELSVAEDSRTLLLAETNRALEYFQGQMRDIKSEDGRSKAVSLDVADTMGWMLPGIIRVFTASQHMAIVEPVGHRGRGLGGKRHGGRQLRFLEGKRRLQGAAFGHLGQPADRQRRRQDMV